MLSKLSNVSRCLQKKAVSQIKITPKNLNSSIRLSSSFLPSPSSGQINFDKKYFSTSSFKCDHAEEKNLENHAQENDNIDIEGLHPISKLALGKMGIDKLFEVQAVTFKKTRQGHDLIVQAPTGSGKTLSFVLPVMEKLISQAEKGRYRLESQRGQARPACLVIAPTRELANQTAAVFNDYIRHTRRELPAAMREITTCCVYGGAPMAGQYQTLVSGDADIVIGTPGRIHDWLKEEVINLRDLEIIIFEEIDYMLGLQWHEQLKDILKHAKYWQTRSKTENKQALLYSATVPGWVQEISKEILDVDCEVVNCLSEAYNNQTREQSSYTVSGTNRNVYHYSLEVGFFSKENKRNIAEILNFVIGQLTDLKNEAFKKAVAEKPDLDKDTIPPPTRTIIFCNGRDESDDLQKFINNSASFHGYKLQSDRTAALENFRSGQVPTLIATDLASRGLDIPDVDFVIHFKMPTDWVEDYMETYINRSGRTGRAGKFGISILMHTDSDRDMNNLRDLKELAGIELEPFLLPGGLDKTNRR